MHGDKEICPRATAAIARQRESLAPHTAMRFKSSAESCSLMGLLPVKFKQLIAVAVLSDDELCELPRIRCDRRNGS
jgi:hypothetical protein